MAILCSQCGAQVPRPDVSRGAILCARCATMKSAGDDEDMATVDQPPPARPAAPKSPTIPAPPPVPPVRPSMIPRPVVGGPPGARLKAGETNRPPRATPSVAPRPATTPPPRAAAPSTSRIPAAPASQKAASQKPAPVPPPRSRPEIKGGNAKVAEDMDTTEFSPLESGDFEPTGDITLATGDFESIPEHARPPLKPPRP